MDELPVSQRRARTRSVLCRAQGFIVWNIKTVFTFYTGGCLEAIRYQGLQDYTAERVLSDVTQYFTDVLLLIIQ